MWMLQQKPPVIKKYHYWNPGSIRLQIQHQQGKHNTLSWCQRWQVIMTLCLQTSRWSWKPGAVPRAFVFILTWINLSNHKLSQVFQTQIAGKFAPLNLIDRGIDTVANDIKEGLLVTVEEIPGSKRRNSRFGLWTKCWTYPTRDENWRGDTPKSGLFWHHVSQKETYDEARSSRDYQHCTTRSGRRWNQPKVIG